MTRVPRPPRVIRARVRPAVEDTTIALSVSLFFSLSLSLSLSLFLFVHGDPADNWWPPFRSAGKRVSSRGRQLYGTHAGRNFEGARGAGMARKEGREESRLRAGNEGELGKRGPRAFPRRVHEEVEGTASQLRGDWLRRYALIESINERQ